MKTALPFVVLGLISSAVRSDPIDISSDLIPFTSNGKVPALATAIVLDGKVIAVGATGIRKHGHPARVTIDDKFHIGSCTKSITGTLAAMLVADGKITWQTTVAEIFPEMEIHPGFQKSTLLQLASNCGGAPGDIPGPLWTKTVLDREKPENEQRMHFVRATLKAPPAYEPGTKNVYSNSGFTIAGAMLEKASGMTYSALIQERLFKPLQIESAGLGPAATPGNIDQPYGHVRSFGFFTRAIEPGPDGDNPPAISPAGRVHLSILDLAKYASFHLGTSENAPLDRPSLDFLHVPVLPGGDYAVGWRTMKRDWAGGTALYHNGSNTMSYAVMWLAPEKKFAAVAACNIDSGIAAKACDDAISAMIDRFLK